MTNENKSYTPEQEEMRREMFYKIFTELEKKSRVIAEVYHAAIWELAKRR